MIIYQPIDSIMWLCVITDAAFIALMREKEQLRKLKGENYTEWFCHTIIVYIYIIIQINIILRYSRTGCVCMGV